MSRRIPLKNRNEEFALVDDQVLEALIADSHLDSIDFLKNLRVHSHGYAFHQEYLSVNHIPKYKTIYLHKLVAERFITKPQTDKKLFVRFIDSNPLNVQLDNLVWATMSELRRHMKGTKSSHGYRGVTFDRGRFRAVLFNDKQTFDLGFHETAEKAAEAYNKKSFELFGKTASLNKIEQD